GLSAGRVQSVAVRIMVEREREILAFKPEEYWTIEALVKNKAAEEFGTKLWSIGGKKLEKLDIKNKAEADKIVTGIQGQELKVADLESKKVSRTPPSPHRTSTLQQDANHKLYFSAKQTMMLAQNLYEGIELGSEGSVGLITYMRTDSENLSPKFLSEADAYITKEFGKEYATGGRTFETKNKGAQEAHEAIRPTSAARSPELVKPFLSDDQFKLYELIWKRAMASQMANAELLSERIDIAAGPEYILRATGSTIVFPGFLALSAEEPGEGILPKVELGEKLNLVKVEGVEHATEPPARFSDATLVKALEEHGIGRPSTYAPTIATIIDRGYVERFEKRRLKPTELAFIVNDLLVKHFPEIVDLEFTAKMENEFDEIALGKLGWVPIIKDFYGPFAANLKAKESEIKREDVIIDKTDEVCEKCGKPMAVKMGRFGKFLACTGFPDCKNTKQMPGAATIEIPEESKKCPNCGAPTSVRQGRFGPFISCTRYPECKTIIKIEKKTGVVCPKCEKGEIIERHSKRSKPFYGCNRYPDCDFVVWSKPTGEKCPTCQSLLVLAKGGSLACSSKECDYKRDNA
ncbi:MAG: type I DNA topoisomerase, partial [bacterium]